MKIRIHSLLLAATVCSLFSCTQDTGKSRGPIVLGDPATIVTETDSQYLQDMVPELEPVAPAAAEPAAVPQPAVDTQRKPEPPPAPAKDTVAAAPAAIPRNTVKGLNVAFKEVTVSIPNISTRSYNKGNLEKANGASYELSSGTLPGNQLQISGAKVSRVQQRYQSSVVVKNGGKTLALSSLGNYTSSWQALKGSSSFSIAGIDARRLSFNKVTPAAIRNAVQKAARSQRMSRKEEQQWLNAVRNVRSADQSPCDVVLRSVMWRIEGSDASGKKFNKEVRIDIPL